MSAQTATRTDMPNLDASIEQARELADEVVGRIRETATTTADLVAEKAPGATVLSRQAIEGVADRIDRKPDDTLMLASALTAGIWIGMVLSRAPRWLLVLLAVPTVIVVLAALPRFASSATRPKRR
jgi:hypothetical protein